MSLKIWDVIKYEGNNNTLVWKHEAEDFNTNSTLIVKEPMEAIFYANGQIADVFPAGRYELKTGNIPVLRRILEIPTGGVPRFHCQVYFVNKVEVMALNWGTDSKVQFIEPTYNFPMEIGARGSLSLRISDAAVFVPRLIGAESSILPETITRYFRSFIQNRVKSHLARTIKDQKMNIFEIDTQLDVLSEELRRRLSVDFSGYGVELVQFLIDEVVRPEEDFNYRNLKKLTAQRYTDVYAAQTQAQVDLLRKQTEANMRILEAQSMAEKRRLEGYSYQDEQSFRVAQAAAENESSSPFTNLGMGLGMMAGVGGAVGGTVAGMVAGVMPGQQPMMGNQMGAQFAGVLQPGGYDQISVPPTAPPQQMAAGQAGEQSQAAAVSTTATATENQDKSKTCICGETIVFSAKFCPHCGAKQPKLCPGCGKEVGETAKFCAECGTKLI